MWLEIVGEYLDEKDYLKFASIHNLSVSFTDYHISDHVHPLAHIEFAAEFITSNGNFKNIMCKSFVERGVVLHREYGMPPIAQVYYNVAGKVHNTTGPAAITYHNNLPVYHYIQNNHYFSPDGPAIYSPLSDLRLYISAGQIHNAEDQPARIYYHEGYKIVEYRKHNRLHSEHGWAYGIYNPKADRWSTMYYRNGVKVLKID